MADDADKALEAQERMAEAHLHATARMGEKRVVRGPEYCQCGETMPDVRRDYGFTECVECAELRERRL